MRKDIITQLSVNKILGMNLRITKNAELRLASDVNLQKLLIDTTSYLNETASNQERLMNIRLGITELPLCGECGSSLSGHIWWSKLCYKRFCSDKCHHGWVTRKRTEALNANNGELAKQIAQKALETSLCRGVIPERIKQGLITKRAKGLCIPEDEISAFRKYQSKVNSITRKQPLHLLENIERRGMIKQNGWHLDHKFSVHAGFKNNVAPEIIGHIANLIMLPGLINIKKQEHCSITLSELTQQIHDLQNSQQESLTKPYGHLPSRH